MVLNVDVPDSKEFFRVKRILDDLKSSPDYHKDRLIVLINMANDLLRDIEIKTDPTQIVAQRFSGTKIVTVKMPENEVVKESLKAIEEQFNTDVAIENLSSLVRFWKYNSKEKDVYKPLLKEMAEIMQDTQVYLQETKNIEALKNTIKNKETENLSLKDEIKNLNILLEAEKYKVARWSSFIQPILDNINVIKSLLDFKSKVNPLTTPNLSLFSDIVIQLILEGGTDDIDNVARANSTTPEVIENIQATYHEFLEINKNRTAIRIKQKDEYHFDIEKYVTEKSEIKEDVKEVKKEVEDEPKQTSKVSKKKK